MTEKNSADLRDAALKVIAEAFNTGHDAAPTDAQRLDKHRRHDGHEHHFACWLCMREVEQLSAHIVDALTDAGLLPKAAESGFDASAGGVLRQLADRCDAGEVVEYTLTRELEPLAITGRTVAPAHPVSRLRIEIHHKPTPEEERRA